MRAVTQVVLPVALTGVSLFCISCVEREIHNIPAGYMGDVFIIHNAPDGIPLERTLFSTTYNIPENGILRSSSPMRERTILGHGDFFYVDENGEKEAITAYWPSSIQDTPENRAGKTVGVWFRRTGTRGFASDPCQVEYQQYYVGTKEYLLDREQTYPLHEYLLEHPVCGER